MPYYAWQGVNIFGDIKSGKSFARTYDDLDKLLFSQNIAIISHKSAKVFKFFNKISQDDKINFFRQLAVLTSSGVRLPDALMILCDQTNNIELKQVIFQLESDVMAGLSLSEALQKHKNLFDPIVVQIVQVGQESGDFGICLNQLCDYLQERQAFYKKIKSAAMLPLITLGFFFIVAFSIFVFIVPRFADVFLSIGKELPPLTKMILGISDFLQSYYFIFGILASIFFVIILKKCLKMPVIKIFIDKLYINMPFIGEIYRQSFLVQFLRSVSILLKSGVRLVPAINISKGSINNNIIKSQINNLEQDVFAGSSLSESMVNYGDKLFPQDLIAIVKVGEESAMLEVMLERAAFIYFEKISRSIFFFTTIFQPMLMIMLGLLVTLLIFAIYIPIFGLASVV